MLKQNVKMKKILVILIPFIVACIAVFLYQMYYVGTHPMSVPETAFKPIVSSKAIMAGTVAYSVTFAITAFIYFFGTNKKKDKK